MITTLARIKKFLNVTDTENDSWIEALIPQVESDYVHIRNRPFDVGTKINIQTTGLAQDEVLTIDIADTEYDIALKENDTAGMITRRVKQQMKPSIYYSVFAPVSTSTSADVYLVDNLEDWQDDYSVLDLSATSTASDITKTVTKMATIYPEGAELTVAQMIQHQLSKPAGVQSESLGDYSVTYADMGGGGYPKSITGQIVRFVVTQ